MDQAELDEWYRQRELHEKIAKAEWKARRRYGKFAVTGGLDAWATGLLGTSELARLSISALNLSAWSEVFCPEDIHHMNLGQVFSALAVKAVAAGVLVPPEPGLVYVAFAGRDSLTEKEDALGWGFRPDASQYLSIHARRPIELDQIAGGSRTTGAAAIAVAMRGAAQSLNDIQMGVTR